MKILELLSDRKRWCQGAYARGDIGQPIHVHEPEACSWCLAGGLLKCYPDQAEWRRVLDILCLGIYLQRTNDSLFELGSEALVCFNDTHSYEEVLLLVQEAHV